MAGTPLMLAEQRAAVDLPQKYLAWDDADGEVFLGYNSPDYVAARAGIAPDSDALATARMGSAGVASMASGTGVPLSDGVGEVTSEGTTLSSAPAMRRWPRRSTATSRRSRPRT